MKVSVIISLCDNRFGFFCRSLETWKEQTEKDFELILVDDGNREEFFEVSKNYINTQYIQIDSSKSYIKPKTFTPVLTNNIGIRMAKGDVVCITGPETLQSPNNIKIASSFNNRTEAGYGLVYKSNREFVNIIKNKISDFHNLLKIKGAKHTCLTRPPHPPAYYYFLAVKKEYITKIGGLDERFCQGYCGEDDDLANRLKMSGITPVFDHKMIGIHQDHSQENTTKHLDRYKNNNLKQHNLRLIQENINNYNYIANRTHTWGDPNMIIKHRTT